MVRGLGDPAASRVRNLNHLWGRLRDFYQVRVWEREAEPGAPQEGPSHLPALCPQEELQLLILSAPPDLQALGFDPFSGTLSHPPFLRLPLLPPVNPCGLCPAEEAVEELEGILRLLLGAAVQVSGAGRAGPSWGCRGGRLRPALTPPPRPHLFPCSVSTGNSSSGTSRASAWRCRVSWPRPSRRYGHALPGDTLPPTPQAECFPSPPR